ncbi:cuticle protein 18.7-like [Macrobrachium rosenbergii]|uniref:cuticle protein 18.7-like n=1 Tax=Macrobrachium rosenbergii TaxID=79674 RepID=UPI0034D3E8C3
MKLSVILALVGVAFAAALPLEAPEPVTDTEEVAKAKEEFQALYDAAAAAAAAGEVPEVVVPEGAPEPVADTEEVAAAKAEFQAAFDAAIASDGALPEVVVPEGAPEPVVDTEDVAAAKATFQAAFDAAAAAAEAAPDNDLDGAISTATGILSPFYTNTFPFGAYGIHAPIIAATPFVGTTHIVGAGAPLVTKLETIETKPITYNALFPGFYGLHAPLLQVVPAAEE